MNNELNQVTQEQTRPRLPMSRTLFLCMAASIAMILATPVAAQPPNFLVIIADDMGFSDVGSYGGEIATPNLDALAADGLRFTAFYNTSRCWPTRSSLLTGYYPQQIRRDSVPGEPGGFGGEAIRPAWAKTIAEYLRTAGYRNYHSGKWHVDGHPTANGFDRSDDRSLEPGFMYFIGQKNSDPDFDRSTVTADHAIESLREHARDFPKTPFFAYVAFDAPHFPLRALQKDIDRYRDRYLSGWDVLRAQRHARLLKLGITNAELSPLEENIGPPYAFPDQIALLGPGEINRAIPWTELTEQQQRFQATKMAIHAAMIDRMDREIGRILEQLRVMDAMENTLILFLSDNGASSEIMVRGQAHDPSALPGSADSYLCLGPGFSSAANTPFRRHKTWVHEGGIATPFIAHWPKGIAGKNEFRSTVAHVIDIAPTILDLAGVERSGSDAPPMSGKSLRPALAKDGVTLHEELWFYHEGNRALRQGDWKIVYGNPAREFPSAQTNKTDEIIWSLYNLAKDRAEQHDLAADYPERVKAMESRWNELAGQFLADATRKEDLSSAPAGDAKAQ